MINNRFRISWLINIFRYLKVWIICFLFMAVGPFLILLNKHIMHDLHFPYPMFLSGLGVLASGAFSNMLVDFGYVAVENELQVKGSNYFYRVLPIAISSAGTLASGNYIYLLLDVGLIQMLKSFTPVIVMLGLYLSRIEIPTQSVIFSILMISVGTAVTCSFSPNVTIIGLLVMLLTTSFESARMVLTQHLLKDLKLGVVESQYFLSSSTAICLFTASFLTEIPLMIQKKGFHVMYEQFGVFVIAASLGIVVNYLSYFVIQLTSSLNLKILGMFRNIVLIIVSIFVYHEQVTFNEIIGYGVALAGFIWYNSTQIKSWRSPSLGSHPNIVMLSKSLESASYDSTESGPSTNV